MNFKHLLTNKLKVKKSNKLDFEKYSKIKYNRIKIKGKNNCITTLDNSVLKECHIEITGDNNNITLAANSKVAKCKIQITANNSHIKFDENTNIQGSNIHQFSNEGTIAIGEYTTFTGVNLISEETNNQIIIGKNCMFSYGISIRNTDSHPIYDLDNQLINKGKQVIINNNVWVGMDVTILKGSNIEDGCVIGSKSLVSGNINKKNSIAAGIPAKIIKENIKWEREFK